jgi:hypothetical protein
VAHQESCHRADGFGRAASFGRSFSRHVWISIGLHTAWDFTEDSLLGVSSHNGLLLSTPVAGKPEMLTGGRFGPDASVLSLLIGVLLSAAIVFVWKRGLFRKTQLFATQEVS